jgi:ketosteroid isomerase-like protein
MPSLDEVVSAYNAAWNRQDLDAVCAAHAPDMVFENHTAGERAEGSAVRKHIAAIFENWPDLQFAERTRYVGEGFVVQEWTATATHPSGKVVSWEGVDIFPFSGREIARKDVYSNAARRVAEQLEEDAR